MRISCASKVSSTADRNNRPSKACARMCGFAMIVGSIWLPTTSAARLIRNLFADSRSEGSQATVVQCIARRARVDSLLWSRFPVFPSLA